MVIAVDEALRDGCERWHVSRPAVTLTPTGGSSSEMHRAMVTGTAA